MSLTRGTVILTRARLPNRVVVSSVKLLGTSRPRAAFWSRDKKELEDEFDLGTALDAPRPAAVATDEDPTVAKKNYSRMSDYHRLE
jgi:hypothetical protein